MIVGTKGKLAANAVADRFGKSFPVGLVNWMRAMLTALDASAVLEDLRFPPGNRLGELKGGRTGQHSVRINDRWRICFVWTDRGPADVEIVDYHWKGRGMTVMKNPSHPGEVLKALYLGPMNLSPIALAKRLHVPRTRIERLVKGETSLSTDTAMRLARIFGTTPEYWMNLQRAWDLARAREAIDVSDIAPLDAA